MGDALQFDAVDAAVYAVLKDGKVVRAESCWSAAEAFARLRPDLAQGENLYIEVGGQRTTEAIQ